MEAQYRYEITDIEQMYHKHRLDDSQREILLMIANTGPMSAKDLVNALPGMKRKSIRYAIRRLKEKNILKKIPNLLDMRSGFYALN